MDKSNIQITEKFEYPAIYSDANNISNCIQHRYLTCLKFFFALLLFSGLIWTYFNEIRVLKVCGGICSIGIVAFSFVFHFYDFQGKWYAARAAAESIKTLSWRYVMKVDPFNIPEEAAKEELIIRMKCVVEMNDEFASIIVSECCSDGAIPESMKIRRTDKVEDKYKFYHEYRVKDQLDWYRKKSGYNKRMGNIFFGILILVSLLITVFLFLEFSYNIKLPISLLISTISIVFTWVQTKKYKELASSYALSAHEINFISDSLSSYACTEEKLNDYVVNAENAFSREHTQWLARKGS